MPLEDSQKMEREEDSIQKRERAACDRHSLTTFSAVLRYLRVDVTTEKKRRKKITKEFY